MKKIVKSMLTLINCIMFNVKYKSGLYIGFGSQIGGGGNVKIGERADIMPYSMIVSLNNGKIEIGSGSTVSMYTRIGCVGYVKIGENVEMGPNCFIADFNHEYRMVEKPVKWQGKHFSVKQDGTPNVYIGDGSWLGTHVVIAGNITIGKHCVIGANSVVTKDIPDYCVAVGIPAKVIKRYNFETNQWERM